MRGNSFQFMSIGRFYQAGNLHLLFVLLILGTAAPTALAQNSLSLLPAAKRQQVQ